MLTTSNAVGRDYIYAEVGHETGGTDFTIRNATHKYIYFEEGESLKNYFTDF